MKVSPELEEKWFLFKKMRQSGLVEHLSIRFITLSSGFVSASMPVSESIKNPFGMLHGGASIALAETAASMGSWMLINPEKEQAVCLEINANHIRPATKGTLTAKASLLHKGSKTHIWQIVLTDEHEQAVCISRCTMALLRSSNNP